MATCPHCGADTATEPAAKAGTVAAGSQLYRTRKHGVRVASGDNARSDRT